MGFALLRRMPSYGVVMYLDWFETRTEEAWRETTPVEGDWRLRVKRVLEVSGPALWSWKADLYWRLVDEGPEWHAPIDEGLVGSAFDLYGDLDVDDGRRLLERLPVPPDARGLKELREKLAPAGSTRLRAATSRRAGRPR